MKSNELGHELLISAQLFNHLKFVPDPSSNLGLISLKGKENGNTNLFNPAF